MSRYAKTLQEVNRALATSLPGVILVKGEGYFYIVSDNKALAAAIAKLPETQINEASITFKTVDEWVSAVRTLLKKGLNP